MAESLSAEQIAERRTNLYAFRHTIGMGDEDELTTTLLMQEEWLATVDASEAHIAGIIKQLRGYARDAHIIRGLRLQKCSLSDVLGGGTCVDHWKKTSLYCAPCYMRAVHEPTEEEEPRDTDELLRRHWQSEAFDPEGEGVTEGWPDEVSWREQFECTPTEITELDLRSISLHTDPLEDDEDVEIPCGGTCPATDPCDECLESERKWMDGEEAEAEDMGCEDSGQAHVWIKMGKVGFGDSGLSVVDWGDAQCLRCRISVPVPDFDVQKEEFFDL